ncbi:tRNA wybutosine-synthesizing protein 2 homolog [Paramormyrops kingsleyae]|uniref:tRNA wybutosine-synthesizing protein 2 homolog n=1 Tax=Paramormyrops kingsleyae TaxID=1676925 RepID=A0A3B3RNT0_9TELE|nr:tRNA wybutosine-synthesizing protein 2 homolog [Paramormyrops kingsleyae]
MEGVPAISVPLRFAQQYREHLEAHGVLNPKLRMLKRSDGTVALPVQPDCLPGLDLTALRLSVGHETTCALTCIQAPEPSKKESMKSTSMALLDCVRRLLVSQGETWSEDLTGDVPRSWQRHGDLALLGGGCFSQEVWSRLGAALWLTVARVLGVNRLAQAGRVSSDGHRTPAVTMLLGEDSWVTHVDNKIRYQFDVTKCMFSAGNITEKLRIASFDCRGETVVDLYAGIGYFTLPYLVHSGAAHVHACEWNPHAVEALRRNLELNGVSDRCTIHQGDNRQLDLRNVADRVNLGLIPSSEQGWPVACRLLKRATGGILHIHQNVTSPLSHGEAEPAVGEKAAPQTRGCAEREAWRQWAEDTALRIAALLEEDCGTPWRTTIQHLNDVKSYAPHIHHIVLDLECRPC